MVKLRSLVSQLCGAFPYNCLQFAMGSILGFQVILIAELYKPDSEIPATLEQLSWFASLDIVKLAATVITGVSSHLSGSRLTALAAALLYIASLLSYYYATSATIIFAGRVVGSLLTVNPLSAPYISEISEPHLRGPLLAMSHLSHALGTFFSLLLGSLLYWRTVALANLVLPIVAAVTVLATPNSPAWLANKGRLVETAKALCWLRGWVEPQQVQTEFNALEKSASTSQDERKLGCQARLRRFFKLFIRRSFYLPLRVMCLVVFVYCLGGMPTTESYATVIFRELDSPIEESLATAIVGAMGVIGHLIVFLVVRRAGKRKLAFLSVVVVGLCHATIAIVGFFELQGKYLWVPPIALIVAFLANASGIGAIVFMLSAEIFPTPVRSIAVSMSVALKMILKSIMNKFFLYAVETITLSGVFLFFAFMNLVALVIYYFLMPETEGRSLREIEDHYKGVENAIEREK